MITERQIERLEIAKDFKILFLPLKKKRKGVMTYQEKLKELSNIWQEKTLSFYHANKEVLAMEGDDTQNIDKNSIEFIELEKAQSNINNLQLFIKENNLNPLDEMNNNSPTI